MPHPATSPSTSGMSNQHQAPAKAANKYIATHDLPKTVTVENGLVKSSGLVIWGHGTQPFQVRSW